MAGPQYTSCVEEKDFKGLNYAYIGVLAFVTGFAGLAVIFASGVLGVVAAAAVLEALRYALDYMLHGKLICLHRNHSLVNCHCGGPGGHVVCAIGEMVGTEDVGEDKNVLEDVDDDYAINLALLPFDMKAFAAAPFVNREDPTAFDFYRNGQLQIAAASAPLQVDLIQPQQSTHGRQATFGYLPTMVMLSNGDYLPYNQVIGRNPQELLSAFDEDARWEAYRANNSNLSPQKYGLPVLHCEFEGARAHDMLEALEGFPFGSSVCKKNFLTRFICRVISAFLAPLALAAVAIAWKRATAGSINPALEGGGTIGTGDRIIVKGSWVYDAGHSGWNEVHATRTVQKIYNVPPAGAAFDKFLHDWCERLGEVPEQARDPRDPLSVGVSYSPLTADATREAQQLPENQWVLHPAVDGCRPTDAPSAGGLPPIH